MRACQYVRRPGYLGSLLIWAGFALSSGSAVVLGVVRTLLVPPYVHRIDAEERLLFAGPGRIRRRTRERIETRSLRRLLSIRWTSP